MQGEHPVFVCASAVHADLVVPIHDMATDWRSIFPDVASNSAEGGYLAIGWGDLGFYHDTPTWSDVKLSTVLRALSGLGPTTLHVLATDQPGNHASCQSLYVDRPGREALDAFILASIARDGSGAAKLLDHPTNGEAFYAAQGYYSPWRTCNAWVEQALAAAGLRHAAWAPFSFGVMWPLR
jgi:uncharacterized protein (TIGR02117 family)